MKVVSAQRESACTCVSRPARRERRSRLHAVEHARDAVRVAVDVGADLEHRHAPIAAGELDVVGLRHHHRRLHRAPGEPLATEGEADLLGVGGHVVVVEDEFVHRGRLQQAGGWC